jgi:hypothetical protein
MRQKISWTDRGKTVYPPPPLGSEGIKNMERAITAYTRCGDGHMVKQTWKGLQLSQKSTIREIGIICACSDHGQPRYQIWIKCDKRLVAYTRCADGRVVKQTWKGLQLSQKSTICETGIICACSDHGQPRYQIWIKSNKRQMTSYVHKV